MDVILDDCLEALAHNVWISCIDTWVHTFEVKYIIPTVPLPLLMCMKLIILLTAMHLKGMPIGNAI